MRIVSPPSPRNFFLALLFFILAAVSAVAILVLPAELDGGTITGAVLIALAAVLIPWAILHKANTVELDDEGITVIWKFRRSRLRYSHTEMTGADFKINTLQGEDAPNWKFMIELIPTGEPIITMTNLTHQNLDAGRITKGVRN